MYLPIEAFLSISPKVTRHSAWNPTGEFEGIEAITYEGAEYLGKKTKIFAYYGVPKGGEGKVPAVVLVHGGGGVPFLPWVKQWNDRGYAAIAMSATGEFPRKVNAGFKEGGQHPEFFARGMWREFCEEGYIETPDNDNMSHSKQPLDEQWMYQAVSAVILAHNALRADERVDAARIGICGVSWGGVITSITLGYDHRFAFAVPIYGSGYLAESMGSLGKYFRSGKNPELWLAEHRFDRVDMPILWQCETADTPFSLNSNSKSYVDTVKKNSRTRLSAVYQMGHSHRRAWNRTEALTFADWICCGGEEIPAIRVGTSVQIEPSCAKVTSLRLFYLTEPMSYAQNEQGTLAMEQEWQWKELSVKDGEAEYVLDEEMRGYYFELTAQVGEESVVLTTSYVER